MYSMHDFIVLFVVDKNLIFVPLNICNTARLYQLGYLFDMFIDKFVQPPYGEEIKQKNVIPFSYASPQ